MPVAFQNPDLVTLLGLMLFLYFLPLLQKKYHSLSPALQLASSVQKKKAINKIDKGNFLAV
jgi:hypothetical protein